MPNKVAAKYTKNIGKTLATFSGREWALIGTLLTANFVNTVAFNCMDAFYPKEAHSRHIDTGQIGLIIGFYQFSRFLMAPIAGKYVVNIGTTLTFFAGLFITASTAIGFGFLALVTDTSQFFWLSLLIRLFQALGRTCFVVSSLTIATQMFPAHISLLGGLLETFAGVGHISGPVVGSALFQLGGFMLPNFAVGSLMALIGVAIAFLTRILPIDEPKILRRNKNECAKGSPLKLQHCSAGDLEIHRTSEFSGDLSENLSISEGSNSCAQMEEGKRIRKKRRRIGYRALLGCSSTWLIMFVISLRGITCTFYLSPLPEHMNSLSSSAVFVGAMFTLMSVSYFISAPLLGIIVDRQQLTPTNGGKDDTAAGTITPTMVMLGGSALAVLATAMMGPLPLIPLQKSIPLLCTSFALLGVSVSALYVPVLQQCNAILRKFDVEEGKQSTRIYACLFGLVQSASTLGSFLGSTLGGFSAQYFGFAWTSSLVAFAHLSFLFIFTSISLISRKCTIPK